MDSKHGGVNRPGGIPLVHPYAPGKHDERYPKPILCKRAKEPERQKVLKMTEPEPAEPVLRKKERSRSAKKVVSWHLPLQEKYTESCLVNPLRCLCLICSLEARQPLSWIDPNILKVPRTKNSLWKRTVDRSIQTEPIIDKREDDWQFLLDAELSDTRREPDNSTLVFPFAPEIFDPELTAFFQKICSTSLLDDEIVKPVVDAVLIKKSDDIGSGSKWRSHEIPTIVIKEPKLKDVSKNVYQSPIKSDVQVTIALEQTSTVAKHESRPEKINCPCSATRNEYIGRGSRWHGNEIPRLVLEESTLKYEKEASAKVYQTPIKPDKQVSMVLDQPSTVAKHESCLPKINCPCSATRNDDGGKENRWHADRYEIPRVIIKKPTSKHEQEVSINIYQAPMKLDKQVTMALDQPTTVVKHESCLKKTNCRCSATRKDDDIGRGSRCCRHEILRVVIEGPKLKHEKESSKIVYQPPIKSDKQVTMVLDQPTTVAKQESCLPKINCPCSATRNDDDIGRENRWHKNEVPRVVIEEATLKREQEISTDVYQAPPNLNKIVVKSHDHPSAVAKHESYIQKISFPCSATRIDDIGRGSTWHRHEIPRVAIEKPIYKHEKEVSTNIYQAPIKSDKQQVAIVLDHPSTVAKQESFLPKINCPCSAPRRDADIGRGCRWCRHENSRVVIEEPTLKREQEVSTNIYPAPIKTKVLEQPSTVAKHDSWLPEISCPCSATINDDSGRGRRWHENEIHRGVLEKPTLKHQQEVSTNIYQAPMKLNKHATMVLDQPTTVAKCESCLQKINCPSSATRNDCIDRDKRWRMHEMPRGVIEKPTLKHDQNSSTNVYQAPIKSDKDQVLDLSSTVSKHESYLKK